MKMQLWQAQPKTISFCLWFSMLLTRSQFFEAWKHVGKEK